MIALRLKAESYLSPNLSIPEVSTKSRKREGESLSIHSYYPLTFTIIKPRYILIENMSLKFLFFMIFSCSFGQSLMPITFNVGLRTALEDSVTCCYPANKQYGLSIHAFGAGEGAIRLELGLGYRFIDLSSQAANLPIPSAQHYLTSFMGLRYYPYYPTLQIGNLQIRITGGTGAGFGLKFIKTEFLPDLALFAKAGLEIIYAKDSNGILVEWLFFPLEEPILDYSGDINSNIVVKPTQLIGLGFVFAI